MPCSRNGSAMGGGFGLVCACDYVIATKQAHATLSEVKLGVLVLQAVFFVVSVGLFSFVGGL